MVDAVDQQAIGESMPQVVAGEFHSVLAGERDDSLPPVAKFQFVRFAGGEQLGLVGLGPAIEAGRLWNAGHEETLQLEPCECPSRQAFGFAPPVRLQPGRGFSFNLYRNSVPVSNPDSL